MQRRGDRATTWRTLVHDACHRACNHRCRSCPRRVLPHAMPVSRPPASGRPDHDVLGRVDEPDSIMRPQNRSQKEAFRRKGAEAVIPPQRPKPLATPSRRQFLREPSRGCDGRCVAGSGSSENTYCHYRCRCFVMDIYEPMLEVVPKCTECKGSQSNGIYWTLPSRPARCSAALISTASAPKSRFPRSISSREARGCDVARAALLSPFVVCLAPFLHVKQVDLLYILPWLALHSTTNNPHLPIHPTYYSQLTVPWWCSSSRIHLPPRDAQRVQPCIVSQHTIPA
jgi:hypothetical protein